MARVKAAAGGIRAFALDPLRNFKHQTIAVEEWGGAEVTVRALSAGDWVEYRRRAAELVSAARVDAGLSARAVEVAEGEDASPEPQVEINPNELYAFVLVRTLFDEAQQRVFTDDDIDEVVEAFSPVHDRLSAKAFELSGVGVTADDPDPVDAAGND
ncbi:phage tail assembly chaperone [Pseudomonas weihenstephanensis]|uniref:Tail assembly chaperone n=1 Tax=Pseudomonas weihenstephanensis TaxID=1608994 RepID=A0ABS1ZGE7_9PSED|nr:phage tail assembly chaperone [Pseudomonas weihenstephanensis]MBM1195536.1 hypothetical protein [Pseudomonas weihenstephanensis]